jgi:hypothetical protein
MRAAEAGAADANVAMNVKTPKPVGTATEMAGDLILRRSDFNLIRNLFGKEPSEGRANLTSDDNRCPLLL